MKGQVWSIDLAISSVVFLLVATFIIFIWNNVSVESQEHLKLREVESLALALSEGLVRLPGVPTDWNETNVKVIGLANDCGIFCENILNVTKVKYFSNLDYQLSKTLMGLGTSEFYFSLNDLNNNVITSGGTRLEKGIQPGLGATVVIPVERFAILNGNLTRAVLVVWSG